MFAPSVRIIIHRASTARGEGEEGRDGWIVNIVEEGRMYTVRQRNHSRVHNMTVDCLPVNSWSTWSSPWVVSCQHWHSIYPGCLYLPVCVSHTPPYSSLQSLCFHSPRGAPRVEPACKWCCLLLLGGNCGRSQTKEILITWLLLASSLGYLLAQTVCRLFLFFSFLTSLV